MASCDIALNCISVGEMVQLVYFCTMANQIYEYFKKEIEDDKILVRINPVTFEGLELLISKEGQVLKTNREFDETIYDDLEHDEFTTGNSLEFNLYLKGIPS